MSSLTIFSIASVTRFDRAGAGSRIISSMTAGTICPPETEPIDQPPARLGLTPAFEERVPVAVELPLVVAQHDHRDGVVEIVVRPCAHRLETLAEEREVDDLDRARRPARRLAHHRCDPLDARIRKDRGIEPRGLLRLLRVPEVWKDLRLSYALPLTHRRRLPTLMT